MRDDYERQQGIIEARYDLSEEEQDELVQRLLREHEPAGNDRFVCYMFRSDIPDENVYANVARTAECNIFDEKFGNNPQEMHDEYGKYEAQSIFFLRVDTETQKQAGALRVIENGPEGLKTLNDIPRFADVQERPIEDTEEYINSVYQHYDSDDPMQWWDIGTVAVPREYTGGSPLLYRAMYVASQRAGIKHFVSVIDRLAHSQMKMFGFPFEPLYGTKSGEYMGSKYSTPLYGDAPKFEEAVRRKGDIMNREMLRAAFNLLGGRHPDETDTPLQF
jgi:hypothetical protein